MRSFSHSKGFTLIEILIVVIILGILAAIVIPQFTNASDDARRSAVATQLQTIRSAVELYKLQHGDSYPTTDGSKTAANWSWALLIGTSLSYDGKTVGPYLQQTPRNPMNSSATVAATAASGSGWVFDTQGRTFAIDKTGGLMSY